MTPRHIVLVVAALAVLALGVYLWSEVRATPATAGVVKPSKTVEPPRVDEAEDKAPEPEKRVASRPTQTPSRDTQISAPPPPPPSSGGGDTPPPSVDQITQDLNGANPKLDAIMTEANKAYDRGDFDDAKGIALKVLAKDPANVRMNRIVVSAACIDGDSTEAQKHYLNLPGPDREQMKVRCARYGVSFNDK